MSQSSGPIARVKNDPRAAARKAMEKIANLDIGHEDNLKKDPTFSLSAFEKKHGRFRGLKRKPGNVSRLMGTLKTPSKKVHAVSKHRTSSQSSVGQKDLADSNYSFRSPLKGIQTSAIVSQEDALKRTITIRTKHGPISFFKDEAKVDHDAVIIPPPPPEDIEARVAKLPKAEASVFEVEITLEKIQAIRALKEARGKDRHPSNQQATNYYSANQLAKDIGLDGEDWNYWHLIAHSLWHDPAPWGDRPQQMSNFILGKKHGNAKMNDLAEAWVEEVLKHPCTPNKLYLKAYPTFVPGYERARLASKVTWVLKDGPGEDYTDFVEYDFFPLSTDGLCDSEIAKVKDYLIQAFNKVNPVTLISPLRPVYRSRLDGITERPAPLLFNFDAMKERDIFVTASTNEGNRPSTKSIGPTKLKQSGKTSL